MNPKIDPDGVTTWDEVSCTFLVPLVARAMGASIYPWLDPEDAQAQQVMEKFGHDLEPMLQDRLAIMNVLWRTNLMKSLGQDFFKRHPTAKGINLGAGLSDYFQWFNNGQNHWLDADLAHVVSLRHLLMPAPCKTASDACIDLTQAGWWKTLCPSRGQKREPMLLLCEGVLMYLTPPQVKALFQEIGENAPEGSELICDFMTPRGIGRADMAPSIAGTGAEFRWGAHNALEVARLHPRMELIAQHTVAEVYGWAWCWAEMCVSTWTGGPLYGVAHMHIAPP